MTKGHVCLPIFLVASAFLVVAVDAQSGDPGEGRVPVAEDAYVASNGRSGTSSLLAGSWSLVAYRVYLKFTLPELPEDAVVKEATLVAYSLVTSTSPPEIAACPAGSGWSESDLTWDEAPALGEPCDTVKITTSSGEYQWNVTKAVQDAQMVEAASEGPGTEKPVTLVLAEAAGAGDGWTRVANWETYPFQAAYLLIDVSGAADVTPPTVDLEQVEETLWPPNNKMVLCAVLKGASDDQDPDPAVSDPEVTSDEDIDEGDWELREENEIWLRAERDGSGDGRVYTVTVKATDAAGNEGTATIEVTVPHDQGEKKGKS